MVPSETGGTLWPQLGDGDLDCHTRPHTNLTIFFSSTLHLVIVNKQIIQYFEISGNHG